MNYLFVTVGSLVILWFICMIMKRSIRHAEEKAKQKELEKLNNLAISLQEEDPKNAKKEFRKFIQQENEKNGIFQKHDS